MADQPSTFEIENQAGDTIHVNGSQGTSPSSIGSGTNLKITKIIIFILDEPTNLETDELDISFDGGSNYFTLVAGSTLEWDVHGNVPSISLVSNNAAGVDYEALINREPV